jgi:hypothetical protein
MKTSAVQALLLLAVLALSATQARAQNSPTLNLEGVGGAGPAVGGLTPGNGCTGSLCQGTFSATLSGQLAGAIISQPLAINLQVQLPAPVVTPAAPGAGSKAGAKVTKPPTLQQQVKQLESDVKLLKQDVQSLQQQLESFQSGAGLPLGCYPASGSGSFEGSHFSVGFEGVFCALGGASEELAGSIWIVAEPLSAGNETFATGTLSAAGALHIAVAGNPIAGSGPMVVSIVGAVGQVPALVP